MAAVRSPGQVSPGLTAVLGLAAGVVSFAWAWRPSYWYDEAATLAAIERSPSELWHMLTRVDAVHGVYYFAVQAWAGRVGTGEAATRLPSALGVALTCAGTAVLAQRLIGRHLAISAGLISAVLPGLSWSGGEARVYAWSALAAVTVNLALLRALDDRTPRAWALYSVLLTVAGYVYLFTLLLLPAHAVTLLLLRRRPRGWLMAAGFALIATGPLTVLAWTQRAQLGWIHATTPHLAGEALIGQDFLGPRPGQGSVGRADRIEPATP
jgi:mannosyltransferase